MSRTSGGRFICPICNTEVGTYGRFKHYDKHVREGKMFKKVGNRRWEFYRVGSSAPVNS